MPVPKRKVSKARRDQRSANKNVTAQNIITCTNSECSEPLLPHMACPSCGTYRNRKVMRGEAEKSAQQDKSAQQVAAAAQKENDTAESQQEQQSGE